MTGSPADARHLTLATLDELWNNGSPMEIPIKGNPPCRLRLDAGNAVITLITNYDIPEPDVATLKNVDFTAVSVGGEDFAELALRVDGNVHGGYGLLATIADELQIRRQPLAVAVATGVARYRDVLASRSALTSEEEIGLFGELLFLEFLIDRIGAGPAFAAWHGPLSEEHDFIFRAVHIEVKTTAGERRRHQINGLHQLVALRGVPLKLLSVQITRRSPSAGRSLPQLIEHVRTIAGGYRVQVDVMLRSLGWNIDDAALYRTFWALRSEPRAYSVEKDFPALTPMRIIHCMPNPDVISDVSYKLDLTNLNHGSLPEPINGFLRPEGNNHS